MANAYSIAFGAAGILFFVFIVYWFYATFIRRYSTRHALPADVARFVRETVEQHQLGTGVVDVHMHSVGMQPSLTGCCLHAKAWSVCPPWRYAKAWLFSKALGVSEFSNSDAQVEKRLFHLLKDAGKYVPYHGVLLAFDAAYDENTGERLRDKTSFYVPNDYVFDVCSRSEGLLFPCCSVHPYRADALAELERCHGLGARIVKWLPNSQFIDPTHGRCVPFYDKMRELEMTLLCHVGEEHSVTTCGVVQHYGDPRNLRCALDRGVKVIMAHCASEGRSPSDQLPYFNLFIGMMEERKYRELLFGDISAMPAFLRAKYLKKLARFRHLHHRLFYGSDYPVPCIPFVPLTIVHWLLGLITWEERRKLNVLYQHNPLLFNLCLLARARGPTTVSSRSATSGATTKTGTPTSSGPFRSSSDAVPSSSSKETIAFALKPTVAYYATDDQS